MYKCNLKKRMFKKKLCLTRELSFNGRKKFFSLVKLDKMRTKKRSFVSNQGITQSWGNRLVQGQCRRTFHRFNSERATILAAFLKGSNKELHKRHPPLIPRDHRIRLNLEFLSFLYKLSWLDNSRPNTILGNCTPLNEKNSFKTSS